MSSINSQLENVPRSLATLPSRVALPFASGARLAPRRGEHPLSLTGARAVNQKGIGQSGEETSNFCLFSHVVSERRSTAGFVKQPVLGSSAATRKRTDALWGFVPIATHPRDSSLLLSSPCDRLWRPLRLGLIVWLTVYWNGYWSNAPFFLTR